MRPVVGVAICVVKNYQVLLQLRKGGYGSGLWGFPGGHLEQYETFEVAALRELREEMGSNLKIVPGSCKLWYTVNVIEPNVNAHYLVTIMRAEYLKGEPEIMESEKCLAIDWFDWDDLPENILPGIAVRQKLPLMVNQPSHCEYVYADGCPAIQIKHMTGGVQNEDHIQQ